MTLQTIIRFSGGALFGGALYILIRDGFSLGWFTGPTCIAGLIVGPGLILHRRWARWPAIGLYVYWAVLSIIMIVRGIPLTSVVSLLITALCMIPGLLRWEDDTVTFKRV